MSQEEAIKLYNPIDFICQSGVLKQIGEYTAGVGKHALLLESPQSHKAAGDTVRNNLENKGVSVDSFFFAGSPSKEQAENYAKKIQKGGVDVVVAVGGGRVMDTAKYAASLTGRPLITAPSISATNASYRRNSIVYTEEGAYVNAHANRQSPLYVLADSDVLSAQPIRYVQSGIIDTLVRKYEAQPYGHLLPDDFHFLFSHRLADVMYHFFDNHYSEILRDFETHTPSKIVKETITNIIAICGVAANYSSGTVLQGFAHPFYNQLTRVNPHRPLLHGEIVGYGILVQLLLEKRPREEVEKEYRLLARYGFQYSLEDVGIHSEQELSELAKILWEENIPHVPFLNHVKNWEEIRDVIATVDELVQQHKESKV